MRRIWLVFVLLCFYVFPLKSQVSLLHNQCGYISSASKRMVLKSAEKLRSNWFTEHAFSTVFADSITFLTEKKGSYYYAYDLSDFKQSDSLMVTEHFSIKVSKNPYQQVYSELFKRVVDINHIRNEEGLRQAMTSMYVAFTDPEWSKDKELVKELLEAGGKIKVLYADKDRQGVGVVGLNQEEGFVFNGYEEYNTINFLLASTCLSLCSFASSDSKEKQAFATSALRLYIEAREQKDISDYLDLAGMASFQLYLIYRDPGFLKELVQEMQQMNWPQNYKDEDVRNYYLIHFSRIYNITDGFLIRNVERGIASAHDEITLVPKLYASTSELIDYGLANLLAFQAVKDIKYLDELMRVLDYLGGVNDEEVNHFEEIIYRHDKVLQRKLLLLLNNVVLMTK